MKTTRLLTLILATALFARADVLPPAQDSSSLKGKLTPVTGKATTLAVSATRKGYVLFNLASLPQDVVAADIVNARLRVYFVSAKKPGDIGIHTVTAGWNETASALEPGVSVSPVAMFPAATVVGKKFVEVEVTATVQAWLTTSSSNNGFAFVASGLTNVLIGSKEGSGTGYPCELDIEIQRNTTPADGSITGAQLADSTVTNAKLASAAITVSAGSGLVGGGTVSLGGSVTLSLDSGLTLGGTTTGIFSGPLTGNVTGSAGSFTGSLVGDVTGTQSETVVASVGGMSAASVAMGANLANAATTANTPNTIVKRDSNGTIPTSQIAAVPNGMVLIPGGAFTMGNGVAVDMDITDAVPISTTESAFYMEVNEVSLSQWQTVYNWATLVGGYTFTHVGAQPKGTNHPVESVDWYDCMKWCNARSEREGKTPVYYTDDAQTTIYRAGNVNVTNAQVNWSANGYRLPTEAEWEKAARGGLSGKRFPLGDTISQKLANYYGNISLGYDLGPNFFNAIGSIGGTGTATSPVGSFTGNGYGLNDMAGNVWEWCWDWYATQYAGGTDPHGPATGSNRILRGGSWNDNAVSLRCASRSKATPDYSGIHIGFRTVLASSQP